MLKGKTIVLAVTGSIAAYKVPNLVRMLKKEEADVEVLMTKNATNFINPITFETFTGHKCLIDTFDRNYENSVQHVAVAKKADIVLVAPATANVIGKIANGLADDMLTSTIIACPCKKLIAPAMNHNMYHNPIVQDNVKKLQKFGYGIIAPGTGILANGDTGDGRMPEVEELYEAILKEVLYPKDLQGKKVLITAGATRESIDPVRFITNHSTGKMGIALARDAMRRGADVTLVCAHTEVEAPQYVNVIKVDSAEDMFNAINKIKDDFDIIIKAAAVSDYTPVIVNDNKIKKEDGNLNIELKRTKDILAYLGEHKKKGQFLCGFSMETENVLENSRKKLNKKNCDMICANSLKQEGSGFGTDTNVVTIITKNNEYSLEKMSKDNVAHEIFNQIIKYL